MAEITLAVGPGNPAANSFASDEDAMARALYRVGGEAFRGLLPDQRAVALATATSEVEAMCHRSALTRLHANVTAYNPDIVNAVIDLAISYAPRFTAMAEDEGGDGLSVDLKDIKSIKVASLGIEFFAPNADLTGLPKSVAHFPAHVARQLMAFACPDAVDGWGSGAVVRVG